MTDYGFELEFGYFLNPNADQYEESIRLARLVDELGFDLIGIQDHPYIQNFFDTWTLMTAVAVQTEKARVFADVTSLPLRPPAVLAKAAASLDIMTGGRVEMGLGAGARWDAISAMGGPRRSPGEAVDALSEAIDVMWLMWSGDRSARFDGQVYALHGVHPGPTPAHPIEIWVGALGPRMLDLIGRKADGWLPSSPYAPPDRLPEMNARIDAGAAAAGREPTAIRRLYNVGGVITDGQSEGFLRGPVDQWVEELTDLTLTQGMSSYILWAEGDVEGQLRRFAGEVMPRVREEVAKERGG